MSRTIPKMTELTALLSDLTGKSVQLKTMPPQVFAKDAAVLIAIYTADDGSVGATLVSDLTFAASAGAALTMISADVVNECAAEGKMTDRIRENASEVLNVAAMLFNQPGASHLALTEVTIGDGDVPAAVVQVLAKPSQRLDCEGVIPGYPKGRISIFLP